MSLSALAHKYGTDKYPGFRGRGPEDYHSYVPFYEELLHGRNIRKLLEIGIFEGASLRMWRDWLPWAQIYGVDIDPTRVFQEDRIQCEALHAGCEEDIHAYAKRLGPWDVVIDDGSHQLADQIMAGQVLIPYTKLYIIEDINTADVPAICAAFPSIRIIEFETWHKDDDILGIVIQ
jgi:hypothetical protein